MKIIIILLFSVSHIFASFDLLKFNLSSKYQSLGDSGVAIVNDVNSLFVNPAGLNYIKNQQISAGFANTFFNDIIFNMNYGLRISKNVFGIGISYIGVQNLEDIDIAGQSYGDLPSYETLVNLTYGRIFIISPERDLKTGLNVKFINKRLEDYKASAILFDVGAQVKFKFLNYFYSKTKDNFSIGLNIQNIGFNIKNFAEEEIKIPFSIRTGIGYDFYQIRNDHRLSLISDYIEYFDNRKFGIGVEYNYIEILNLRAGYSIGKEVNYLSTGAGVEYDYKNLKLFLDTAFVIVREFENLYQINTGVKF